jgi:TonB family C-terminal domain
MKTRIENANGLWWRLVATLSVLAILFTVNTTAVAQNKKAANDKVYDKVEVMPEYPGGEQAMMKFVATNVKYPQAALDKNISGRVMVQFVVEKDGSVTDVKTVKGIGGGCDEEAVRVVKAMPKWKPGMEKGKTVRVQYLLPITFKLQ